MSANHLLWIEFRKVEINWLYLVQWDEQFIKLNLTYATTATQFDTLLQIKVHLLFNRYIYIQIKIAWSTDKSHKTKQNIMDIEYLIYAVVII